jgi:hypothetical protein
MTEGDYVRVVNDCPGPVVIYLRRRRPKKGQPIGVPSLKLLPGEKTRAVPRQWLVGAKGWEKLRKTDCVIIESVEFKPRFVEFLNSSRELLQIVVRVPRPKAPPRLAKVTLKPRQRSRVVDLKTVRDKKRLDELMAAGKLEAFPTLTIGAPMGRGKAVGSYYGENVYTCHKCGGPIVFRGAPPTPVHV